MTMTPDEVVRYAKDHGVRMVDVKFTDVPGTWQHFSIPMSSFEVSAFDEGIGFDGSSIRGFQEINESDMLLVPDPSTAILDPFTAVPTLSLICDVAQPGSLEPYTRDPRYIARKAEQHLKASTAPWTIVRSPAYRETWLDILADTAGSTGRPLVFGHGDQPIPFASVADVADVVCRAAGDPELRGRVVEVAGEPVTMNQLARTVQEARDWHGSLRHVPRPLLRAIAVALAPVNPAFARQNRAALVMDTGTSWIAQSV